MRKLKWLIIVILLIMTTGCWQYKELNDLALVSAVGIDREKDEYLVTVQIVNTKKQSKDSTGSAEEAPVTIYEDRAKTIGEALNKLALQSPKELYLQHIDIVVIGEETAKYGLREYIDFLLRNRTARKVYPVLVAKKAKANDVLKVLTPIETMPANDLVLTLENAQKNSGILTNRTFDNVLMCLFVKGRHTAIPAVEIIKPQKEGEESSNISSSDPQTRLKITGPAVFLEDKLVGFLNNNEGLGYNFIRQRVESSIISFKCDNKGNYGAVKIDRPNLKLSAVIKDKQPIYTINVKLTATLTEYNCEAKLKKSETISKVEEMVNKRIKEILDDVITATQKQYKTDVLGFGEILYREHYQYWKTVDKKWNQMYPNVKYKADVKTMINNTGSTTIPAREGGAGGDY